MIRASALTAVGTPCKPRASGDDPLPDEQALAAGDVNPARAGMIRSRRQGETLAACKPRASGDDPGAGRHAQEPGE